MASAPRKTLRLPSMCATTKPTSARPVTAITTFLPTMVPQSTAAGLLGHTLREARACAGRGGTEGLSPISCVGTGFLRQFDQRLPEPPGLSAWGEHGQSVDRVCDGRAPVSVRGVSG